jgi:hypothetical protein
MSNPLKRRMARAALLLAAGAAPVIGSAGAANAVSLPPSTDLGGLSNLDTASVGDTVEDLAEGANSLAGDTGGEAVQELVPAAGTVVGTLTKAATPTVLGATGTLMEGSSSTVGQTMSAIGQTGVPGNMPTSDMPVRLLGS